MNQLNHVALIMDGNGRWAKQQNKARIYGHLKGIEVIPNIVETAIEQKIKHISFFAFSTENWDRSKKEVNFLLDLFFNFLTKKNLNTIIQKGIKVKWIGFLDKMPKKLLKKIYEFELLTKNCNKIQVNLFFNYSGTKDIDEAIKKVYFNNTTNVKELLLTKDLPPIDLLIRTSGEKRISNFALYDLAYSEMIFEKTFWPSYTKQIFLSNISEYNNRSRRFGKIENE